MPRRAGARVAQGAIPDREYFLDFKRIDHHLWAPSVSNGMSDVLIGRV
jgi:hypothetical protein